MRAEVEGEDPAHIDVLMHRRRNAGDQLVGVVSERVMNRASLFSRKLPPARPFPLIPDP